MVKCFKFIIAFCVLLDFNSNIAPKTMKYSTVSPDALSQNATCVICNEPVFRIYFSVAKHSICHLQFGNPQQRPFQGVLTSFLLFCFGNWI